MNRYQSLKISFEQCVYVHVYISMMIKSNTNTRYFFFISYFIFTGIFFPVLLVLCSEISAVNVNMSYYIFFFQRSNISEYNSIESHGKARGARRGANKIIILCRANNCMKCNRNSNLRSSKCVWLGMGVGVGVLHVCTLRT